MISIHKILIAFICCTLLWSITVFCQTADDQKLLYKTGNPADWPKDQDAVISAPNNYQILVEITR